MKTPPALRRTRFAALSLSLLIGLSAMPGLAHADDDDDGPMPSAEEQRFIRAAVARGDIMPLPRLMAIAQKRVPGEIIEVDFDRDDGQYTYEFKILTRNGRVFEVEVNARTGVILEVEDD